MSEVNLEKKIKVGCVSAVLVDCINKKLFGEVLTIVDASSVNFESNKAIKSLISQAFSRASRQVMFELNNLQEVQ